ncbi:MAG: glycosyltransferase [Bacteroidales bacterium]|nr:glycosyltransferase [Bacteroidales bacterium]
MLISIITATFNSGKTVRDTLESILGQTFQNYELIIKDGGSKDDTLDICREYQPRFGHRMRIISAPDKGIYDAMNQGIAAATGDVVGILNSDDFYAKPQVLEIIANTLDADPDTDAVYADVDYVSETDTSHVVRHYSSKVFRPGRMRMGFMPAHPTFYCRKKVYDRFQPYFNTSYKIAADFENLLRMIYVGGISTKYIQDTFVSMRVGGASSSGISSHRQILRDHRRALRENGVKSNLLMLSLRYIYKIWELLKSRLSFFRK